MRPIIIPLAALATLSACGESETAEPVAVNNVVTEAGKLNKPVAGQYRSTTKLIEIDLPGMPPSVAQKMKDQMSQVQSQTNEFCLTAEEVDEGWENMAKRLNNASDGADCQFDKFNADGGNLDAQMTCKPVAGAGATIAMTGKMEPEKQTMKMVVESSGGPGQMNMTLEIVNERIGECAAKTGS